MLNFEASKLILSQFYKNLQMTIFTQVGIHILMKMLNLQMQTKKLYISES